MIFNFDETNLLISSIETYNDKPRGEFPATIQQQFAETTIKKLNNLSVFSYFTKQEYTFMALCVRFINNSFSKTGNVPDGILLALLDKLLTLAEPSDI